jgi:hypothetical protein
VFDESPSFVVIEVKLMLFWAVAQNIDPRVARTKRA